MRKFDEIDKNFKIDTKIEQQGIRFYNPLCKPFEIYGVKMDDGKFRRLPETIAKKVSEGVHYLHANTAGGRVRFRTDSPYIAINVKIPVVGRFPHFALTGSAGFDVYVNEGKGENYCRSLIPRYDIEDGYESLVPFESEDMRDVTVNFPLYSEVAELYIGLDENAKVEPPTPYINTKPIVFYGSSITQGGCASRPGNSYQAYISRRFNCDYINLGFSGGAKAEDVIIEYIKNLEMSVFVYDYDHNTNSAEHLRQTHEKMFKEIRENHPDIPVIIMTAPIWKASGYYRERRDIIETTYKNALASGDENVYFLDGDDLMRVCENNGTVDNCHPNDLGFFSMAKAVGDLMEKIGR